MKNLKRYALVVVLGLTAASTVFAEDAPPTAAKTKTPGPCHDDFEKFCKGVEKGGGKRAQCLKEHKSEVSSACSAQMDERKRLFDAMKAACKADRDTLCKDKKGKELRACMKENKDKVSQSCKDAKAAAHPKR